MKTILQFGYKKGIPTGVPLLDCRVIKNPYKVGVSEDVLKAQVRASPEFGKVVKQGFKLLTESDTIACGCLWGVHRSGAVAEELAKLYPNTKILKV